MEKKFAIFDMDGTLVDSMGYWHNLTEEYLESEGITEGAEEVLEKIYTMTMAEACDLFKTAFGIESSPEEMRKAMDDLMEWHYLNDVPLKGEVVPYLEKLKGEGVRMCVASATPHHLIEKCLKRLGVFDYFEFMISCETIGIGKTKPDIYLLAAEKLGAELCEIAVYEDALYAVKTAKNAGFYTFGIKDESNVLVWDDITELADELVSDWENLL